MSGVPVPPLVGEERGLVWSRGVARWFRSRACGRYATTVYPGRGADIVMQSLRPTSPNDPVNPKTVDSDLRSLQLGVFGLGSDGGGIGIGAVPNVWIKEMAALVGGGHFDSTFCDCLRFYWRAMTCNALPLSVRHLYPCIGKALIHIHRLPRRIGALCFEGSRRDGRIAKRRYLQIVVVNALILGGLRRCQRLGPDGDFPFG